MAGLFQVLWGQEDGTFKKAEELKGTDGEPLIIPVDDPKQITKNICTRPIAVDWDADGDLDLVVGNFEGSFYVFQGEGKGKFLPKPESILSGGSPLKVRGAHSDPFVIDWDGDGDLDLLSGSSSGGVYWAENSAGASKAPRLEKFQTVIAPGGSASRGTPLSEENLTGPTTSTRIWVDDVNSDGKLDVLVGDSVTLVSPAEGLTVEDFEKKHDEWQKASQAASKTYQEAFAAYRAASKKPREDGDDRDDDEGQDGEDKEEDDLAAKEKKVTEARQNLSKLYQEKSKFMKEERTGFVWLYLQK